MSNTIQIKDKSFELYIDANQLAYTVNNLANRLQMEYPLYQEHPPLILVVLNGSYIVASDITKQLTGDWDIKFIKVSSYQGTESTGTVTNVIGIDADQLVDRHVFIIEDIVDTGHTVRHLLDSGIFDETEYTALVTLFYKPDSDVENASTLFDAFIVGMEIPNDFIVGYGLDYDGLGRNLPAVYKLV